MCNFKGKAHRNVPFSVSVVHLCMWLRLLLSVDR